MPVSIPADTASKDAPTIRPLDTAAEPNHNTVARMEAKYPLPGGDIGAVRAVLETNCRRVVYGAGPVTTVRSIYFDDCVRSAYQANLDGVGRRRKIRIRWYDTVCPRERFWFEIKWRRNRVTGKHRFPLNASSRLSEMPYRDILAGLLDAVPEEYRGALYTYPEPTVLVEYRREHFVSHDESFRVTLDYDLRYYDQTAGEYLSVSFGHSVDDLVIVEGKAPVGRQSELAELLYPLSLRARRCSKYVLGCETLGIVRR